MFPNCKQTYGIVCENHCGDQECMPVYNEGSREHWRERYEELAAAVKDYLGCYDYTNGLELQQKRVRINKVLKGEGQ